MVIIKIKYDFENIFILLFIIVFLWAGIANLWNNEITHEFPYGYLASDSFMQAAYADAIKNQGHYLTNPPHMSGGFEDVIGFQPSILYHLTASFSNLSGIEAYDSIVFLVFLFALTAAIIMYFTIRKFNKNIAIISLPLSLLIFTKNFYIGFTWGQWGVVTGTMFLIAIFWSMSRIEEKNMYIILGIILGAALLGHTSEGIMAIMFLVFYEIIKAITVKLELKHTKKIAIAILIGIVLSVYYLIIFKFTWLKSEFSLEFSKNIASFGESATAVMLSHFSWILPFILIGIILAFFIFRRKFNTASLAAVFMFLMGYSYLLGSGRRATQSRLFWPIYLSVFMGITIYYACKLIIKKWRMLYSFGISILLAAILLNSFYTPIKTQGLMDTYHWDLLMWIKENTQENTKTFYFPGDVVSQNAVLYYSERPSYIMGVKELAQAMQNGTIPRKYSSKRVKEGGGGGLPYRKSIFEYGYYTKEEQYKEQLRGYMDICKFDYYVFNKLSRQQALADMNMVMREVLVRNGNMTEVYSNPVVSVIKNPDPQKDCIPEQGVKIA